MARVGRINVFSVDLSAATERAFGRLRQAKGFSLRAQQRMAQEMREAVEERLEMVIQDFPVRTGAAQRSARARAFGTSFGNLRGVIVGPAYVKVLNDGAEIEPQSGEFLAIPFGEALRPDGTPKLPSPLSWKNIRKTFIYKSKKTDGLYVAYKRGDGDDAEVVCLYTLVPYASVMPRGFLDKSWRRQSSALGRELGQIMLQELSRVDIMGLTRVTSKGAQ